MKRGQVLRLTKLNNVENIMLNGFGNPVNKKWFLKAGLPYLLSSFGKYGTAAWKDTNLRSLGMNVG